MNERRSTTWRDDARAGALAVAPLLLGVVPFGLVAGAAPVEGGLGAWSAVGFSTIVFAGASQLAAIDVLADGGTWLVAAVAACTINLRLLLYSASMAPFLAEFPLRQRLLVGYVLTDQAYVESITRWQQGVVPTLAFYYGAAFTLWGSWQVATIVGALGGGVVPDDVPLTFAVPLAFLVLFVPLLVNRPAVMAALAAGVVSLVTLEVGLEDLSILLGALAGIAAGAIIEARAAER
ncbi:MAG TPA: AzlC family ABC transporter permease [Acidimicrobiales bacterium]|nr:AzlC family ABC transporter permease [Acidimicrobiales bacterium]